MLEKRGDVPPGALPGDVIRALDGTKLTPAGALAAALPVDLRLSRLVNYGAAVGALEDSVLLAAGLSQQAPPWVQPLPLPQLYGDAQDYLVAARQALLSKRHFDEGQNSEPLALLRALRRYRDTAAPSEKVALCATYTLSAARMRQLDAYAGALAARVRGCVGPRRPSTRALHPTLGKLLLCWAYFDQVAVLEKQAPVEPVVELVGAPILKRQLQSLFPPNLVSWTLYVGDGTSTYTATRVKETEGGLLFDADAQGTLLAKFLALVDDQTRVAV